ncbi:hypothetical protein BU17DRAFT_89606 [Hysterangium stoloniferum]|nr:hypothetical protein BU17DRAFT_89606 [Hysterangium stoloniferum]
MVRSLALLALAGAAFAVPVAQSPPAVPAVLGGGVGTDLGGLPLDVPFSNAVLGGVSALPQLPRDVLPSNVNLVREVEKLGQRQLADIEATLYAIVKALVKLCLDAGVNVQALLLNIKVVNSDILTNILNGNNVNVGRDLAYVEATVIAAVKAFLAAAVKLNVPVEAALLNIGISYSKILSNDFNWNDISILSRRNGVDVLAVVTAIIKAVVAACANVNVPITAVIGNVDIKYVTLLTNLLNHNKIDILRRDVPALATVVLDLIAYVTALIYAAAKANLNIFAALANIGIDCSSILSNIGNDNNINILTRDLVNVLAPVKVVVVALIQVLLGVEANIAASILNIVIKNSSIGSNILNYNTVNIL